MIFFVMSLFKIVTMKYNEVSRRIVNFLSQKSRTKQRITKRDAVLKSYIKLSVLRNPIRTLCIQVLL